jgi:hypothetical protein
MSLGTTGYHAVSLASPTVGWAVGEGGRIAKFIGAEVKRSPK